MDSTAIDIASAALVHLGEQPITSFKQQVARAVTVNQLYESTVSGKLGEKRWGFARTTAMLARLAATPEGSVWQASYQLPADLLLIHRVTINGQPIRYERYGDAIQCNAVTTEPVYVTYSRRVPEAEWPDVFRVAIEYELAARFAFPVTAQESLAAAMRREAIAAWAVARGALAQEVPAQRLPISRMKAVRLGRG